MSIFDTPLVNISLPPMQLRFFAGEHWEPVPFIGAIMKLSGAIYINRGTVDRRALKEAMEALQDGDVFGLAPEGTRSKEDVLLRARDGAAYLAVRAKNVPVLPIGVANTEKWWFNLARLRRTRFQARIGQPFLLPDLGRRPKSKDLAAYSHLIMVHIAALLPERYHGYYKDSPALAALLRGDDPWPYCLEIETEANLADVEPAAEDKQESGIPPAKSFRIPADAG
jgi:1-acyl-sn-glycerol-3-phosphate acyltransferase